MFHLFNRSISRMLETPNFPSGVGREAAGVVQQLDRLAVLFPGESNSSSLNTDSTYPSMAFNPVDTNSYRRLDKLFDFGSDKGTTSMVTAWSGHNYTYSTCRSLKHCIGRHAHFDCSNWSGYQ